MKLKLSIVASLLIIAHYTTASEQQVKRIVGGEINSGFIEYRKGGISARQALRSIGEIRIKKVVEPGKHIAYEWGTDFNGSRKLVKHDWENEEATAVYNRLEMEYKEQEKEKRCVSRRCIAEVAYGVGICGIVTAFFYRAFKNPPRGYAGF